MRIEQMPQVAVAVINTVSSRKGWLGKFQASLLLNFDYSRTKLFPNYTERIIFF